MTENDEQSERLAAMTDAPPPQQPEPCGDSLGLCVLPKGHEGRHETSYERVSQTPEFARIAEAVEQPLPVDPQRLREAAQAVVLAAEQHTPEIAALNAALASEVASGRRPPSVPLPVDPFDNTTEACRHCPTPDVHPTRIGGVLTYEGRCDPDTCEKHDHAASVPLPVDRLREALTSGPDGHTVVSVLMRFADSIAWPHSGYDPAVAIFDWANRIEAALTAPTPAAPLDVEQLAAAIPDDALDPYSDWSRDGLARTIHAEYARLTTPKEGEE